jgi:hypothetical protein
MGNFFSFLSIKSFPRIKMYVLLFILIVLIVLAVLLYYLLSDSSTWKPLIQKEGMNMWLFRPPSLNSKWSIELTPPKSSFWQYRILNSQGEEFAVIPLEPQLILSSDLSWPPGYSVALEALYSSGSPGAKWISPRKQSSGTELPTLEEDQLYSQVDTIYLRWEEKFPERECIAALKSEGSFDGAIQEELLKFPVEAGNFLSLILSSREGAKSNMVSIDFNEKRLLTLPINESSGTLAQHHMEIAESGFLTIRQQTYGVSPASDLLPFYAYLYEKA